MWKEGNVLFNDAQQILFMASVKVLSDSERGNPLPPLHGLFSINSKGSFISTIPQAEQYIPQPLLYQSWITD